MFDPNKPVPPEVLQAMLELSTAEDSRNDIDRQLKLSEALLNQASQFQSGTPAGLGGAASAIAKGIQGYTGGKMYAENRSGLGDLRKSQMSGRKTFFDLLLGQGQRPANQPGSQPPMQPDVFEY